MKKFLFSLVAAAVSFSASAQSDLLDNPDNHPYLGARIGVDVTSPSGAPSYYSNGAGFTFGAVYNIPLYMNLYFEPGLSIFYNTFGTTVSTYYDGGLGSYDGDYDHDDVGSVASRSAAHSDYVKEIKGSIRNLGFRMPLAVGYHFDFTDELRVAPFTGPQLNGSIIAHCHDKVTDPHSAFGSNGFKHLDVQWIFGVGVTYDQYYVGISGGVGVTRCYSAPDARFSRNTFNISLGYNF